MGQGTIRLKLMNNENNPQKSSSLPSSKGILMQLHLKKSLFNLGGKAYQMLMYITNIADW